MEKEIEIHTAVVTVDFAPRPEKISTFEPFNLVSTPWPPVTLAKAEFVNSVGITCDLLVKADAGNVPWRT